jgi:hypothetical protein
VASPPLRKGSVTKFFARTAGGGAPFEPAKAAPAALSSGQTSTVKLESAAVDYWPVASAGAASLASASAEQTTDTFSGVGTSHGAQDDGHLWTSANVKWPE